MNVLQKSLALPAVYREPVSSAETSILATPLDKLVANIKKGEVKPIEVLRAYGKKAIRAHEETNCLTEIMIEDAEKWATESELKGPLAGIPGIIPWLFALIQSRSRTQSMSRDTMHALDTLHGPKNLPPKTGV